MSDPFTIERFLPRVGEVFHVMGEEGEQTAILLTEVTRLASDGSRLRTREPFSLVFHAPRNTRLEQQVYLIANAWIEPFECFLVPIEPDQHGARFEAIYT
jgi:hypothetical protein